METIVEKENMHRALKKVRSNKGAPGVDGITTEELEAHLQAHWPAIKGKLLDGTYKPGPIKGLRIPKPQGGERLLGIANTQDRLIQQSVQQLLTQLWDVRFSEHSYGFRPGRSNLDAIRAAKAFVLEGKTWVVDIDIEAFFDQVNHDRLMSLISQDVHDKRLMRYLGQTLRADMLLDGQRVKRTAGTPQGGPISPLLANLYLDALDKELEARGLSFCRYADDLMIYVTSERSADRVLKSVTAWIEKHLKLKVSASKSGTGRPWDRDFLGYNIDEQGNGQLSGKTVKKYRKKVRELWSARQSLTSTELIAQWGDYVRGWYEYFRWVKDDFKGLSQWTRRHMRKCFWQRWHSREGRIRKLRGLGISNRQLTRVSFHDGSWRAARHPVMHQAMSLKVMQRWGLWTPQDFASAVC
ncbi:group II intron reverse transcriptase/maturase [Pseudomonas sp. B21-056]|jgi:group II intron reverse transcriptase/maturase|uniref:group II intron reverse transcriptase/maturase n=1 Tax=Pseudomonas sp. B21-056 TaxID=2895495 RepID=UPI00222E3E5B|nr:group II intron reverse transcriptase/maturase [Pseudomonas sp. B21-056]UZE22668.1 group II intron reverse transcriptase/maturase [Pseudomonas sp. B21-056]UZE23103.1 group II intron reverse transcriptase/maturase [Pseudomonas sp. B21-056]UZE23249.1 group II intron reverse transcriptase/maturase [Pseudomonas sp. B21-056]